jgi:hypothetical protein
MAGFLAGAPTGVPVATAAACKAGNPACGAPDTTKTSAMSVNHHTSPSYLGTSTVVQADSGESWSITAYWNTAGFGDCWERSETATVDVDWNGSAWVLSNKSLTTNIVGIDICSGDTCDGGDTTLGWNYKLTVDITDPVAVGLTNYNLRTVQYTTTSVDDGYTIEDPTETYGDCYEDASVSPTSQSNTAYDIGPGPPAGSWTTVRCGYSCDVVGGTITLNFD